jgi:phosphomevalonate kinase
MNFDDPMTRTKFRNIEAFFRSKILSEKHMSLKVHAFVYNGYHGQKHLETEQTGIKTKKGQEITT